MSWFNAKERSLIWKKNIQIQEKGSGIVHQRLIKQYEVIGIVCALIMGSLMTLTYDDYNNIVQSIKILGLLSASLCVTMCLIFIVIIQWIPLGYTHIFIEHSEKYMNFPLIFIIISLTALLISILLHFERIIQIIFAPVFSIAFISMLYMYGDIRKRVLVDVLDLELDA